MRRYTLGPLDRFGTINATVLTLQALIFFYHYTFKSDETGKATPLFPQISKHNTLGTCPPIPPLLKGPLNVSISAVSEAEVEAVLANSSIMTGGRFRPQHCQARHKVALVVPFRNRESQLPLFLQHMHPFLQRQELAYTIFIVEQSGNEMFNGGMLKNIGFLEAIRSEFFECVIFHDVDMFPENDLNIYSCPETPRHMAALIDRFGYKRVFESYFGGVVAFPSADFCRVNGYSNQFWGWGGEDDNLRLRVTYQNLSISRDLSDTIPRYKTLYHKRDELNSNRWKLLEQNIALSKFDGLSTLKYTVLRRALHFLYTHVEVEIHKTYSFVDGEIK